VLLYKYSKEQPETFKEMFIMTEERKKNYIALLKSTREVFEDDTEMAHIQADEIICAVLEELGCKDIVDEYNKIYKWYA
jgi:hypothetical protein